MAEIDRPKPGLTDVPRHRRLRWSYVLSAVFFAILFAINSDVLYLVVGYAIALVIVAVMLVGGALLAYRWLAPYD